MRQGALLSEFGAGIAITGMSCILPGGVDSHAALWEFLCEGRDAIGEVPPDRWNNNAVFDPDPGTPGMTPTRHGGFVADIAGFDAGFFGISPREAAVMDPQQRMLLETAWRALEDAGVQVDSLRGSRTGVYIGISHSDYHGIQKLGRPDIDVHTSTGGALSIAANRLSHRFDLRGASLSVDTACSSSLVALDLACAALRSGECDMALVGGVNAILTPDITVTFSRASMLSPDGRCKTFDARANGYVRGEGAVMVVLKPVARALADEDRIHAVIRATAVNQDGQTTTITVPSLNAQIAMLKEACSRAAIDPAQVGYVEAHGTGTPVGDPIEAEAIGQVFGKRRHDVEPCLLGSIKTNIGHLEPAAGVTGLIKAVLCVKHGMIPPHLNFDTPNPNIDFGKLGIEVCTNLRVFPERTFPRIAAVNSFGFGGTNACAVIQQPPRRPQKTPDGERNGWPMLLPLSAANRNALEAMAGDVADKLGEGMNLPDVAGTLALRRSHLDHRMVAIAHERDSAVAMLRSFADKTPHERVLSGRRRPEPRVAFVFTGQGAHWWAMGRGLLDNDPVFRKTVEEFDEEFRALSCFSIIAELTASQEKSRLDQTIYTQPATFALQVGLAARWKAWGVTPSAVVGHSIGEMAAAHICGALTLRDAVKVVYHRSRLQEQTRLQGGMAAVGLSAVATSALLEDMHCNLEIAAINAPELVTIAGSRHELERLLAELAASHREVFTRLLRVDYAFHSQQMDPFEEELRANLAGIVSRRPEIAMFSTVSGQTIEADELSEEYWWRNMRWPVVFKDAVEALLDADFDTFVELGAHPALAAPLRSCLAHRGRDGTIVASLHRDVPDQDAMVMGVAELHVCGVPVNWASIAPQNWNFIELAGQRFEKPQYWAESEESRAARFDGPVHPLLGYRLKTSRPTWQSQLSGDMPRYLGDHSIDGSVVFPAAGYVELILAAGEQLLGGLPWELEDITFHGALVLAPQSIVLMQTSVDETRGRVEIRSRFRGHEGNWDLRASARVRAWSGHEPTLEPWLPKIAPPIHVESGRFYRQLRSEGHEFGPAFQGVDAIWREYGQVLGIVRLPAAAGTQANYLLHPSLLDACFQVIRGFRDISDVEPGDATLALPVEISQLRLYRRPSAAAFCRAIAIADDPSQITANLTIVDESGEIVATIRSFRCRRIRKVKEQAVHSGVALYQENWLELAKPDLELSVAPSLVPVREPECWLMLSDRRGTGAYLARALQQHGIATVVAFAGKEFRRLHDEAFECPAECDAFKQVIAACGRHISRIVHFWTLDQTDDPLAPAMVRASQYLGTEALIAVTAAAAEQERRPKLAIVTAGSVMLDGGPSSNVSMFQHASMLGAARTIANEFPDMKPRVIDFDPNDLETEALLRELLSDNDETEIAIRGGSRFGCRLERIADDAVPLRRELWNRETRSPMFRLTMRTPGLIEDLVVRDMPAPAIEDSEVLIEVHAVGLNFRDVMAATGLLPADAEEEPAWQNLGFECAGVVRRVGKYADSSLLGARVVAVVRGSFASHVAANAALTFVIPDSMPFAEAAALPTAYTTAQYSLATIGRIQHGERVLIHAAAGGVGLAAVSVARKHGAEIIATAGSEEKRAYLKGLGIVHVFDSRSLSFADDVMAATAGYGVDIVLNSLPGPFLEKGLSLLAPGGRFLEIGKRDIYADTLIGLRTLRHNGSFCAIDLARLAQDQPAILRGELESVIADIGRGCLDKLPIVEFPMARAADAFRHMARARHIGKVVLTCDGESLWVETSHQLTPVIRPDATYLVTGGTAGFGLRTARWLVEQGARHLVLVGRSSVPRGDAEATVCEMRAAGAEVITQAADLTSFDGVRRLFEAIGRLDHPLRGIFHAAGVIDDALVLQLGVDRIRGVFEPKVLGALHLHEATRDLPLDLFVCFSSVAAHLGSIGQAHYAGANAVLEAFATMRRRQGMPCLTIAWGAIGDAGYLTRNPDVSRYLQRIGVEAIAARDALDVLGRLLTRNCHRIVFADVNWARLARANPMVASSQRTAALARAHPDEAKNGQQMRSRVLGLPQAARTSIVMRFVCEQIAAVLKVAPETVEPERPLVELGLDSLTSFELKNRIEAELSASLPIGAFLQKPTVQDLARAILEKIDTVALETTDKLVAAAASDPVLSVGQEALWYAERLAPGSPAYGLAMCISVRPHVDGTLMDKAVQLVLARHECLRWSFPADAVGPIPVAAAPDGLKAQFYDATAWDEQKVRRTLDLEANSPFDLAAGPPVRVIVYRRDDCDILLLHVHHIVADATSVTILLEQMFEAYLSLRADLPVRWSRPAPLYSAYALAQRQMLDGPTGASHLAFWRKALAGAPAAIALPTDFSRPRTQRGPGGSCNVAVSAAVSHQLAQIAQEHGTTLFAILFGAFNVLMHRLSGDKDIVIGIPAGGRVRAELEDAVGYFVNPLPIRNRLEDGQSFRQLLTRIESTARDAFEHQEFPFARIVSDLDVVRDPTRAPIFQVMFAMEQSAVIDLHGLPVKLPPHTPIATPLWSIREFKIEVVPIRGDRAQFDLTLIVEEVEGQIYGVVDYRTDLWDATTINCFVAQYQEILQEIATSVDGLVGDRVTSLPARPPLAGRRLPFGDVVDVIRAVTDNQPESVAIEAGDERWTYRELLARADTIASGLRVHDVGACSVVGLCLSRTADLPASMLGVLGAGAAFLPLEASDPPGRLARVIADAEPELIVVDESSADAIGPLQTCPVVALSELTASKSDGRLQQSRGELAFIVPTLGSAGAPTGVEIRREALSSLLAAVAHELSLTSDDALLAVSPASSERAILELLLPLTLGGRVVVADESTAQNGTRLASRLAMGDITVMQATPATWQAVLEAGWQGSRLFTALVAGERLLPSLSAEILKRAGKCWKLYGPTETTICSTLAQILPDSPLIPIGRPIANATCLIVDEKLRPVPAGVVGELLVGGIGLARGYRGDPQRTAGRFVTLSHGANGDVRYFRTGDFVRSSYDDTLLYLGRRDRQITVRDVRIDLNEIETILSAHPSIREAVSVVQGIEPWDIRIAAYVTTELGRVIRERELFDHMRQILPKNMVPSQIVQLSKLSRLANGEIDRARLVTGQVRDVVSLSRRVLPGNTTEQRVLEIAKEVLDHADIGLDDNFFAFGGTSLLAMRYLARISDAFDVDLGPGDLMAAPSVSAIAAQIDRVRAKADLASPASGRERVSAPSFWRPLAIARAEKTIPAADAAAIACLPDETFCSTLLQTALGRPAIPEASSPHWAGLCSLSFGNLALLIVPVPRRDFFGQANASWKPLISNAIAYAARLGVRSISLPEIISSADMSDPDFSNIEDIALTTGHAAVAASMCLTVSGAVSAAGRALSKAQACFVGLGDIGTATFRTALHFLDHPTSLLLCDVPAKLEHLEALANEARDVHRFRGRIRVAEITSQLPDVAYEADLFIAAASIEHVIDIDRLVPGSIVVDESYPHGLDLDCAVRRFAKRGDVLFVNGGSIRVNEPVNWTCALPPGIKAPSRILLSKTMLPANDRLAATIVSSLLPRAANMAPTPGGVTLAHCRGYWQAFQLLGITAAPLHYGSWAPTAADLERFRSFARTIRSPRKKKEFLGGNIGT